MIPLILFTIAMAFTPTNHWQIVPEGEAIPKGLEVKMDLESGNRFARLAQPLAPASQDDVEVMVAAPDKNQSPREVGRPILDLGELEDLAHDIDHGQEFMEQYGAHLLDEYETSSLEKRDGVGKILGIAVRNNPQAASLLLGHDPELPARLASRLDARDIYILANLATAQYGAVAPALKLAQRQLSSQELTRAASKQIVRLIRDVSHVDKAAVSDWAGALQDALEGTDDRSPEADGVRLELLKGLSEIVEQKNEFAGTSPQVSREFVSWLAEQAVRSDASGVGGRSDNDKDISGQFLQYVKQVRHRVFGNPRAERLHMDL